MTRIRPVTSLTRVLIGMTLACGPSLAQGIITTLAGTGFCGFTGDGGAATSATLCSAQTPAADAAGNVYFPDNQRIRRVSPDGTITTIAGNGIYGTSGDGGPALSASLGNVFEIAVHGSSLCFGDSAAGKVRCVDLTSGLIFSLAPTFSAPWGIAFDDAGNIYVSDFSANAVQEIATSGAVTTIAGPGPGFCCAPLGDGGPAAGANLYEPMGIYFNNGAIYIADTGNNRIRRVDLTSGIINSVNANGSPFVTNGRWIATDPAGDLFVAIGTAVQEVDTAGNLTTVAGVPGISGFGSDDIPATQSYFGGTDGIGWDPVAQRLLISDAGTRVRQIFYTPPTTTTLTSSANPATPGSQVTLQATVSPVTATGNVRFYQDATPLGSVPLTTSGATFVWTAPVGGSTSYGLRAVYGGDANDNLSASPTLTETVGQQPTTTTVTAAPNPSVFGTAVTLTAAITPSAATGSVQFFDGSALLGTAALSSGAASLTISSFNAGPHAITAVYGGSIAYLGSTSPAITQTVNKAATTTSISVSPSPAVLGGTVTFTAGVLPVAATGTVQFLDGSAVLGTAALSSGTAAFSTASLAAGNHSLSASYSGDRNFSASVSGAVVLTVNVAPPSNLAATAISSSQINLGWTASPSPGVTYNVYASTVSNFVPSVSNLVASGVTTTAFASTNLAKGTTYFYRVTAASSGVESAPTNQASATTRHGNH